MTMNKAEALAILREVQETNEGASKALKQARVISGRQQAKVDEAAWINSIKEEKKDLGTVLV
jgi:hypothetical protein